jgi:lysophospholipase L1-like esterase
MKTIVASRKIRGFFLIACAGCFFAAANAGFAPVQNTNLPAAEKTSAADVSQFPSLDQLPGKVPPHVWPGLAKVWQQQHAHWEKSATNDVGAVVFLGDSITQGWSTLAADFPNLHVANRGIGGDITSGVLYRLQADVLSLNPSGIVLLIGTNDIGDGADPADVAANIRLILLAIKQFNPNLKVIVCKIMPRTDGEPRIEKIKQANGLVEQFVKTEPSFIMCDTFGIYLDDQGHQVAADFKPDHLHLVAAGYADWKKALEPLIAEMHWNDGKAN